MNQRLEEIAKSKQHQNNFLLLNKFIGQFYHIGSVLNIKIYQARTLEVYRWFM